MKYISTRGNSKDTFSFREVVFKGLCPKGGLFVPNYFPKFTRSMIEAMIGSNYQDIAFMVMYPFVEDSISETDLKDIIGKSYNHFNHQAIAPLNQLDHDLWILELFHGPTLAFKDFALQFLGNLLHYFLEKEDKQAIVLGATSGDTGSAAIAGCAISPRITTVILHPKDKISDFQRKQMTTHSQNNVHNIALIGNFDDCQNIVKHILTQQQTLSHDTLLLAVNSINWVRIMAQIVYYFYAATRLGSPFRAINFAVPTGNFGDIYAGFVALKMGLPIEKLLIATNKNDILHRLITNNEYQLNKLEKTLAPSMDIIKSSNFERLLHYLYKKNGNTIEKMMQQLESVGGINLTKSAWESAKKVFGSYSVDDEQITKTIHEIYNETHYLIDPHTAVAVATAIYYRQYLSQKPATTVVLSTAHPVKFQSAIQLAGLELDVSSIALINEFNLKKEFYTTLPNSNELVINYLKDLIIE